MKTTAVTNPMDGEAIPACSSYGWEPPQDYVIDNEYEGFWIQKLDSVALDIHIPLDFRRPGEYRERKERVPIHFPEKIRNLFFRLTGDNDYLMYTTLMSGLYICMHKYTGADRVVVGCPGLAEGNAPLGVPRALPMVMEVGTDDTYRQFLMRVRETLLEAYAHQDFSFRRLKKVMESRGSGINQTPLFHAILVFEDLHAPLPELKNDMTFRFRRREDKIEGQVVYNRLILKPETISQFASHYMRILQTALESTEIPLSRIAVLTREEQDRLIQAGRGARMDFSQTRSIPELFEYQAETRPLAPAVIARGETISFQELNRRANQLARRLMAMGMGPDQLAGILLERSIEMVVALMAVLKTGGAYIPMDTDQPETRLQGMTAAVPIRVLITREDLRKKVGLPAGSVVCLDAQQELIAAEEPENLGRIPQPEHLAYTIFTSGSTGAPKAAGVSHRGWCNLLFWYISEFGIASGDRFLLVSSFSFDLTQKNIIAPLIVGGQLHLQDARRYDPGKILEEIHTREITLLNCTPSAFYPLVERKKDSFAKLAGLRCLFLGGEPISAQRLAPWVLSEGFRTEIANTYGPTECTDISAFWRLNREDLTCDAPIPIGHPAANASLLVLDRYRNLVPPKVVGVLYIGGAGVGHGYINDSVLTAEKFAPLPGIGADGELFYCTGDLARRRADGVIEFVGRVDHQVKIRGHRIELTEIENALRRHPAVRDAAVTTREEWGLDKRLVAYILAEPGTKTTIGELRDYIKGRLPEYMRPAFWVLLDEFPLSPNGKVDRKALPPPAGAAKKSQNADREPQDALEAFLVDIWREALNLEAVGRKDHFFNDLGGDSIQAAIFINKLQEKIGANFFVISIYSNPTIAGFSRYLKENHPQAITAVQQCGAPSGNPTTPGVQWGLCGDKAVTGLDFSSPGDIRAEIRRSPLAPSDRIRSRKRKLESAVFILSPPRCGSTLTRVMMAGHPGLFCPPELELLSFEKLSQRKAFFAGKYRFWLEGAPRAIMALKDCTKDEAGAIMKANEEQDMSAAGFYQLLQQWMHPRRLVDKTPSYSLSRHILKRAEELFHDARYIHLARHPYGMITSFEEARLQETFDIFFHDPARHTPRQLAEIIWFIGNRNIIEFLGDIPGERRCLVRFEDLLDDPEETMRNLCRFIDIPFHAEMLTPYRDKEKKMTDGLHPQSKMIGDYKFHYFQKIEKSTARRWQKKIQRDFLANETWRIAEELGYSRGDAMKVFPA